MTLSVRQKREFRARIAAGMMAEFLNATLRDNHKVNHAIIADQAVKQADALLAALEAGEEPVPTATHREDPVVATLRGDIIVGLNRIIDMKPGTHAEREIEHLYDHLNQLRERVMGDR